MERTFHLFVITTILAISFLDRAIAVDIPIVKSGQAMATLQIGALASPQEQFAAEEIQTFIYRFTNVELDILTNRERTLTPTAIVLGTPESNPTACKLLTEIDGTLGDEGYQIEIVQLEAETVIVITANTGRGILYGAYALIEVCITALTGLSPVDLDFAVPPSSELVISSLFKVDKPFYPVRATLETEDPDWLTRHRINMSGAEGVWTGTGSDDGLGTAFKYVDSPTFEPLQDEPLTERRERIRTLRDRFDSLNRRGIDSYLFMYVTGEPTEALIARRPDLLGPAQLYRASRNRISYRPFCWSKPEFHELVRQLVGEIVKTYPTLSGFHLRAWGRETRACNCPECGDPSESGQEMLWQVIFTIIRAAREVRPDFKCYLSGYDQFWLKDPVGLFAQRLPKGTIFSQKWGYDGEPVSDPRISTNLVNRLGRLGHHLIVLSHDVEEVMPFWMLEGDLFVEGVRQLANNRAIIGLSGFTLQGAGQSLGHLDRILSAKMNWAPEVDYLKLLENYLATHYGANAAKGILSALRVNSRVLSSYFSDYAGSLSIGGRYGKGSASFATRFFDIIGAEAVNDTLSIPNLETAQLAVNRLTQLLSEQQNAANQMQQVAEIAQPISPEAADHLHDGMNLMRLWVFFFQSRLHLVEAIVAGYDPNAGNQVQAELKSAMARTELMVTTIEEMESFVPVFDYSNRALKVILIGKLAAEIELLSSFDPEVLVRAPALFVAENTPLEITGLRNFPNPFERDTTLIYELNKGVETISISIYTTVGRRVRVLADLSARSGYNEAMWNGRDKDGERLASGVYFYKIRASVASEQAQEIGRLAILR